MFTGIIQTTASVAEITPHVKGQRLLVRSNSFFPFEIKIGDSIAVNGVCLTAVEFGKHFVAFDLSPETIKETRGFKLNDEVNIEPAMRLDDRLGGHLVSGHIDGIAMIESWQPEENAWRLKITVPQNLLAFIMHKGSITLDGISLTINAIVDDQIDLTIIPHTYAVTNLKQRKAGDFINVEVDLLAKYVARLMQKNYLNLA